MASRDLERSAEGDRDYLSGLDDAALKREGIARMLRAEGRGAFPLRDPAYRRLLTEVYAREEADA